MVWWAKALWSDDDWIKLEVDEIERAVYLLMIEICRFSCGRRSVTGTKKECSGSGGCRAGWSWRQTVGTVLNSFDKKSKKVLWESIILKLKSCGRKYANFESFLKHWKQSTCIFFTFFALAKWPILHFKTAHFTFPNESFCRAKRPILRCKMSHFENEEKFFSVFVQFFYPNKRFRLSRMKKKVDRIFR